MFKQSLDLKKTRLFFYTYNSLGEKIKYEDIFRDFEK